MAVPESTSPAITAVWLIRILLIPLPQLGAVSDAASPALAEVRAARAANRALLRSTTEEWARRVHARGAAESRDITLMRDRFCVGIKVGPAVEAWASDSRRCIAIIAQRL